MKRILSLTLLLFSLINVYGQSRYSGQTFVGATGGYALNGFYGNVSLGKVIGNFYFMGRVDINYSQGKEMLKFKDYEYLNREKEVTYYSGGVAIGYSFETILPHPLYFQIYVGPFGGYEKMDFKKPISLENAEIDDPSKFMIGAYGVAEGEISLSNSTSILLEFRYYYKLDSKISEYYYNLGAGLKFNF